MYCYKDNIICTIEFSVEISNPVTGIIENGDNDAPDRP